VCALRVLHGYGLGQEVLRAMELPALMEMTQPTTVYSKTKKITHVLNALHATISQP